MQIYRKYGNRFSKPAKTNGFSGAQSSVMDTSLVNFKHKITTSANYTDSIGTGYTS